MAVSSAEELEKIRKEAAALKGLSEKLVFWDLKEVIRVSELIEELMDSMQRLGLTKIP